MLGALGLVLSLLVAGLFHAYVFSFSYMLPAKTATTRTLIDAPALALPNQHGDVVRLADLRGRKVIVIFYRGFW